MPFTADKERQKHILEQAKSLQTGMTAAKVFQTMGQPDYDQVLARPFESASGWSWNYSLHKVYRHAPDNDDSYIEVIFNKEGIVSEVVRKNLPEKVE